MGLTKPWEKAQMKRFISPKSFVLLFVSLITLIRAELSDIHRLEPPFWWSHFKDRKLELMVYGKGIGKTKRIRVYNSSNKIEKINVISLKKQTIKITCLLNLN